MGKAFNVKHNNKTQDNRIKVCSKNTRQLKRKVDTIKKHNTTKHNQIKKTKAITT